MPGRTEQRANLIDPDDPIRKWEITIIDDGRITKMTENKGIIGKDFVTLTGRGGREYQNGATCKADKYMHLSVDIGQTTICGHLVDRFLLTDSDVDITCPKCIKILKRRGGTSCLSKRKSGS